MSEFTSEEKKFLAIAIQGLTVRQGPKTFPMAITMIHKLGIESEYREIAEDWMNYGQKNKLPPIVYKYENGDIHVLTLKREFHPYTVTVRHPCYNEGKEIVVAQVVSDQAAGLAHEHWVTLMTHYQAPSQIMDTSGEIHPFTIEV